MNALMQQLYERAGIAFDPSFNAQMLPEGKRNRDLLGMDSAGQLMAMDAAYPLVTTANSGIPAMLSTYIDPKLIEVLVAPMKAAEAAGGEKKLGDWTLRTAMFPMIESTGEVTSYGDYNNSGSAGVNVQFPQRQSYHYQVMTQWGERELAEMGLAKVDLAAQKNIAAALSLNKYQNKTYLFGVSGLQNYGMLNDPALPADITPNIKANGGTAWIMPTGQINATNLEVFEDVQRLVYALIARNQGFVDASSPFTMVMSPKTNLAMTVSSGGGPSSSGSITTTNAWELISKAFPNLKTVVVPEYSTAAGEKIQLIVDSVEGQKTMECAFTEKMRAHPIIVESSSFKQKKSAGTWGTVIYRPGMVQGGLGY